MPLARTLSLGLIGTLIVTPVIAQEPGPVASVTYQSPDACLRHAGLLGQAAEDRKLPDDRLEDIDDLLLRMETHCDARQFSEAAAVAGEIMAEIDKP